MMTRRGWGGLGVALAIVAGAALYLVPRAPEQAQVAPPQGADWLSAVADGAVDGFERLDGPWALDLPADHGAHPEARSEVWQLSAHLRDGDGQPVGVQFLLFRIGLTGPDAPAPASDWEARDLYRGHVVLVTPAGAATHAQERFGRGMAGLAGHDAQMGELRLDSWALAFPADDGAPWRLTTGAGDLRVDLTLVAEKAPLAVDADAAPFRGYAFSRMRAEGTLATAAGPVAVSGTAWFEHLWGDLPIPGGTPVTSDRLQVQLDDGSELSVVRSRRRDGSGTPTVEALLIDPEGTARGFGDDVAQADPTRLWQGAQAGWPVDWRLQLEDLDLEITPVTDAQEHAFMVPVWSGLVRAQGRRGDRTVSGLGTLQVTAGER